MTTHRRRIIPPRPGGPSPAVQERRERLRAMLDGLMREQGLCRFVRFGSTVEGRFLPNGVDETSGYVLDEWERVFFYWTGWDEEAGRPIFTIWRRADDETNWLGDPAYQRARAQLGFA
jgi:hypothetical protein